MANEWDVVEERPQRSHYDLIAQYFPEDARGTAAKVMKAESSGRHDAINPNNRNGTTDRGLFQINDVNIPALQKAGIIKSKDDLFYPETNVQAAAFLHQQSGFKPWRSSQHNWSKPSNEWDVVEERPAQEQPQATPQVDPQVMKAYERAQQVGMMGMNAANQAAMNTQAPNYAAPGVAGKAALVGSGINQGIANTLGLPVDAVNAVLKLAGVGSEQPVMGSDWIKQNIMPEKITPQGLGEQVLSATGEQIGGMAVPGMGLVGAGMAGGKELVKNVAPAIVRSGIGSGAAREFFPENPYVDFAAQLAGGVSPKAAAQKVMDLAPNFERDMMLKALKPTTNMTTKQMNKMAEDALAYKVNVSEKGAQKSLSRARAIDDEITARLDEDLINNSTIDPKVLADRAMKRMKTELANDAFPAEKMAQVESVINEWKATHTEPIAIGDAQRLKKSINKETGPFFDALTKPGNGAMIEKMWTPKTKVAVADEIRSEISRMFPELAALNKEEGARLALDKTIQRTVNQFKIKDVMSWGDSILITGGSLLNPIAPAIGITRMALRIPTFRSHLAIALRGARNKLNKGRGGAPYQPTDIKGNPLVSGDKDDWNMTAADTPRQIPYEPFQMKGQPYYGAVGDMMQSPLMIEGRAPSMYRQIPYEPFTGGN